MKLVTADWCGQCPEVDEMLSELKEELGNFELQYIDFDKEIDLMMTLQVKALPTVLIYDETGSRLDSTILGIKPKSVYEVELNKDK